MSVGPALVAEPFSLVRQPCIRSSAGAVLEQGPATKGDTRWVYPATSAVPPGETPTIETTAVDRPGRSSKGTAHR